MKRWLAWLMFSALVAPSGLAGPPRITAFERSQGWRLMFDGESLAGWHSYGARRVAANWAVQDGSIVGLEEGRALVSDEVLGDFELTFQWRVEAGGRAEVYFRVAEDEDLPARTGPVFQLAGPEMECGGNGGLIAPEAKRAGRPGEWESARLVVVGDQVEYWVAGQRVSAYGLGSPAWRAGLAGSRFADFRDYGRLREGAVALAGRGAAFRNLKVRAL